jgi:hypothetical protein
MFCRKKNRVGCEVILQRMQEEADRRRDQGGDPVRKDAWAPVLADAGTGLSDIRVECEENDPQRVWRLETLLAAARAAASEQERWNETLYDRLTRMGVQIGKQEGEIERQGVTIGERDREIERLQKENDDLRQVALGKITTIVVKDLQEKELCVPLCCPISMQLFKDPVVSKLGHSFERRDIEEWLVKHECCPMTRENMTIADLAPNFALAGVADAFRAYQAGQAK